MQSHAAVPIAWKNSGDEFWIYFGTRNERNQPHIGRILIQLGESPKLLDIEENPILSPGPLGYFDDNGVYPGCIVEDGDRLLMYYLGRSNGAPPLYYMSIGLAQSIDGGKSFERVSNAPLMTRSEHDPWMVSTAYVLRENNLWRMWYLSGLKCELVKDDLHSWYHIKYAESPDGLCWKRDGLVCIDLIDEERNISSPTVVKHNGLYHMWFSYVSNSGYRIGYAESVDGLSWVRKDDQSGIAVSDSGWDSEAQSYPYVFDHEDTQYLLYSGNGFGKGGIGIAIGEVT